jgi:hypothetical protein
LLALIAIAAMVAMLTGVGFSLSGGEGAGPLLPFPEGGDDGSLEVAVNRTTLPAGGSVQIEVTREDATPVENATIVAAGHRYRTGPEGTVVVGFPTAGTYDVTVLATDPGNATGVANATVHVRRPAVELQVVTNRSSIEVGESVAVTLRRSDDGSPVPGVVAVGDLSYSTGPDGRVVVTVDRGGTRRIVGRKAAGNGTRFVDGSTTVEVRRSVVEVTIDLADRTIQYGNETRVTVARNDTGEPLEATVTIDDWIVETGPDGTATVPSPSPGSYSVVAEVAPTPRTRFESASARLDVRRRVVDLVLTADRSRPTVGKATTLAVRREDTGDPANATVDVGDRTLRTGPDGRVSVAMDRPGQVRVVATRSDSATETFESAERFVTWVPPAIDLVAVDVPGVAAAGRNATVNVTLVNREETAGSTTAVVDLSDGRRVSRTVRVSPGDRHTASIDVLAPRHPGQYYLVVRVGGSWRVFVLQVVSVDGTDGGTPGGDGMDSDSSSSVGPG